MIELSKPAKSHFADHTSYHTSIFCESHIRSVLTSVKKCDFWNHTFITHSKCDHTCDHTFIFAWVITQAKLVISWLVLVLQYDTQLKPTLIIAALTQK